MKGVNISSKIRKGIDFIGMSMMFFPYISDPEFKSIALAIYSHDKWENEFFN